MAEAGLLKPTLHAEVWLNDLAVTMKQRANVSKAVSERLREDFASCKVGQAIEDLGEPARLNSKSAADLFSAQQVSTRVSSSPAWRSAITQGRRQVTEFMTWRASNSM